MKPKPRLMLLREQLYQLRGSDSTVPAVATAIRQLECDVAWTEFKIWQRQEPER
jgi:hypothetical protein